MGTQNDQEKEVSAESTSDGVTTSSPENEIKNEGSGTGGPILLFFIIGLAASLILGWIIFPKLLYSQKKQPIDFNHVLHVAEVEESCESCHYFREDGSFTGVPELENCIDCHEETQGEDPDEAKLVEEYIQKGKEVPWMIYSRQPDSVFFSHAAHVKMGKIDCVACHGPIGESENLRVYEENRITGYSRDIWGKNIAGFKRNTWDRMKMDDCAECHAKETVMTEYAKSNIDRMFMEVMSIPFPKSKETGRKSSVQTEKDACFVCHK
jgi:hypothetical protein